ncbi:DUF4410 domain-containing protein [Prosthecobacter sp.]|uniref:DUF4410 domain-containing protein n=1 Tax=Prosthecobacter sp. TaxID=1965333 RepID=UPI003784E180
MTLSHALRLSALTAALALCSCATSTPHATIIAPLTAQICQGDEVYAKVTTSDGRMTEAECETLGLQITRDVQAMAPPPAGAPNRYDVEVNITRYSGGNFFARTLLPGTGQIRTEGTVTVYQMPKHVLVGQFVINKHFMIGGIYGATVDVNTISTAFSRAVAKTLCQVR